MRRPFHLAFPVADLAQTRHFYGEVLGCKEGRSAPKWVDFDFFGHQISAHLKPEALSTTLTNFVDGDGVPLAFDLPPIEPTQACWVLPVDVAWHCEAGTENAN